MSKISYIAEFTISDGKVDEFKTKAESCIDSVKGNEPETLGYQWYLGDDGTRCLLQETFSSSEAMLTHLGNVGPSLPELLAIAPITRLEILGSASAAAVGRCARRPRRRTFPEHGRLRPLAPKVIRRLADRDFESLPLREIARYLPPGGDSAVLGWRAAGRR